MKRLILFMLLLAASAAGQTTSFYTDRAVGTFPVGSGSAKITALIPIQFGPVRVCSLPLTQQQPCLPLATITDINSNPISNSIGGAFGQLTTDVVGRFTFGCQVNLNYQIQVAPASSNVPQLNYPITCPGTGATPAFTSMAVASINHQRGIDGFIYSFAGAGLLQAYADCVADANCSGVSTDGIITAGLGASQLNLVAGKALYVKYGTAITGSGNPVVTYPPAGATIIGSSSDISNGSFSAVIATTAGARPLGPASNSQNTQGLLISYMDFWNQALNSTATVCDLTNVSNSTFISMHCQRSSASGTPSNILIQCSGGSCASFHNDFIGVQSFGPGVSWDFEAPAGAASGPNGQHVYGGRGDSGTICIGVNLGGSTNVQMNGLSITDLDCEAYSATGYSVQGPMVNTNLSRVRFESPAPAQISSIANLGSIGVTNYWGPGIFGAGQVRGTENGKISWRGYQQGAPGPTTEDFLVGSISALSFIQQNGGTPSTFTNTQAATPDIVQFSGDATANSNVPRFINTHAGGHSIGQGEIAGVGRYGWRDGAASFFDIDFTAGGTGELSIQQTCTQARCQVSPLNDTAITTTGTKGATSQKAETGTADANVLTVTPLAVVGTYRACTSISVSSATAGVIAWTLSYKNSNGVAQTNDTMPLFQQGTAAPNTTFTTSAAGEYQGCWQFDVDNSAAAIVVKWVGGGTTAAKMSATVERLQ